MSTKPNYFLAKAEASRVLAENYLVEPAINPVLIANNYGLSVLSTSFENEKIAGYINFNEDKIFIASSDPKNRQTFTIAHELGHYFLHKGKIDEDKLMEYAILYRNPIGLQTNDWIEKEANAFAAELLVPEKLLKRYMEGHSNQQLAELFNVSIDVVGYRLQDLSRVYG